MLTLQKLQKISLFMMILVSWSYADAATKKDSTVIYSNERVETKRSLVITKKEIPILRSMILADTLRYKDIVCRPDVTGIKIFQKQTKFGNGDPYQKLMNVMMMQPLFETIKMRYPHVPIDWVIDISMTETGTCEGTINESKGDKSGAGVIHMQPRTATSLGLKVYAKNKLKDPHSYKKMMSIINTYKNNQEYLFTLDERLDNLRLFDAIARMISEEMLMYSEARRKNSNAHTMYEYVIGALGPCEYINGRRIFNLCHLERAKKNLSLLKNKKMRKSLEEKFNKMNNGMVCFDEYITEWNNFYITNYPIKQYAKLPIIIIGKNLTL